MGGAFMFSGRDRENLYPQVLSGVGEVPLAPCGQDVRVSPGFICKYSFSIIILIDFFASFETFFFLFPIRKMVTPLFQ